MHIHSNQGKQLPAIAGKPCKFLSLSLTDTTNIASLWGRTWVKTELWLSFQRFWSIFLLEWKKIKIHLETFFKNYIKVCYSYLIKTQIALIQTAGPNTALKPFISTYQLYCLWRYSKFLSFLFFHESLETWKDFVLFLKFVFLALF